MYASVCHQYLQLLHALDHWGTETTTASPKHLLVTQHPGGPTQGTPGHVPDHFLTPSQPPPPTRFFDFSVKNRCWDLSCHGHRIRPDALDTPKLCRIALPPAKYRTRLRVLKSDIYFCLEGASKTPPSNTFVTWSILQPS